MRKIYVLTVIGSFFAFSCNDVTKDQDPAEVQALDSLDAAAKASNVPVKSMLSVIDVNKGTSFVAFDSEMFFEAPNWTKDGRFLHFNSNGKIYKLELYTDGLPEEIPTGFAQNCNNDHVLSPDNKTLGISHAVEDKNISKIYTLPAAGGTPKLVTQKGPSYLHGWSPDGNKLVYCAERKGEFDIYTIGKDGKNETRLTNAKGLDDAPEYSPDGKYIYFNSDRTGLMQIWRMDADGKNQIQITFDEYADWFPHVSPDGKKIVFLSYDKNVKGHPANKNVQIRMMNTTDYKPKKITELFGGQGTINVNSWSPDSRKIAFIKYEPLKSSL